MPQHRPSSTTTCLITGATGKQGGAVAQQLLHHNSQLLSSSGKDEGKQGGSVVVRFLTRSPQSGSAVRLLQTGANAYEGDLLDLKGLKVALQGVHSAFLMTYPLGKDGAEAEVPQGKNFIDAAKESGVKHIVFTSVCAADEASSVPHFHSKYQVEEYLKQSGLSYTILRPVAFMDNFPVRPSFLTPIMLAVFYSLIGWRELQLVAVQDIGVVAAKALLSPESKEFKNQTIDLSAGPYEYNDCLDAFEKAQGTRPWYLGWLPGFLIHLLPFDMRQMMYYLRNSGYPKVDVEALQRIHPGLQTLQDYVARQSGKVKQE